MDFQLLDTYLRTYTKHEKEYLAKSKIDSSSVTYTPKTTNLQFFDFKKTSRFLTVTEHNHDYIEMNYVYSGTIYQKINGEEMKFETGDLIILDTQVKHSIKNPGNDDILLAFRFSKEYFTSNFFKDFNTDNHLSDFLLKSLFESQKYNRYLHFHIKDEFELTCIIKLLVIEFIENSSKNQTIYNHYINILFEKILIHYEKTISSNTTIEHDKQTKLYFDIMNYLEDNYKTATVKEMSTFFNYSPNYLSSLIKLTSDQTFYDLLFKIRLKKALILLENTALSISDICDEIGFSNQNTFYSLFRNEFNTTPKKYRLSLKK